VLGNHEEQLTKVAWLPTLMHSHPRFIQDTRRSTILWVGVFKKWAALRNIGEDMETYEVQELDKFTINLPSMINK
jgi:hypothetical protein